MNTSADAAGARPEIWTLDDVAVYLRCSRRKVDYIRKREGFPKSVTGTGSHPRFIAAQVIAWLLEESVAS